MQKGIIFDIKRFAVHDGPGLRTTVFFKGCPLQCQWCHNPESISLEPQKVIKQVRLDGKVFDQIETIGKEMNTQEVIVQIMKDKIFYEQSGGGVTISGGEPLLQFDFLKELLISCKKQDLHVALDTCGLAPVENFESILEFVDLFLFDMKIIDDDLHKKYTASSIKLILKNLRFIAEKKQKINIRIPVIPNVTDHKKNLDGMMKFLRGLPMIKKINLLPYHNIAAEKYKRLNMKYYKFLEPSQEKLDTIKHFWEEAGYQVKIGG